MDESNTTRKLRAIMFTDIVGYTTLMQHDETEALKLLQKHKDLVKEIAEKYGGKIIKHIGDEILIESESAVMLVYSAQELQKKLAERNASVPRSRELWVRVGIHIGDVIFKDHDIFGDGVNIAARLRPLAEPGGICISHAVLRLLGNQSEIQTSFLGLKKLKNIDDKVKVYNVHVETTYQPSLDVGSGDIGSFWAALYKYVLPVILLLIIAYAVYALLFKSKYRDYELEYFKGNLISVYAKTSGEKDVTDIKENYYHILSATGTQYETVKKEYFDLLNKNPHSPEALFYLGLTYYLYSDTESQADSAFYLINMAKRKGMKSMYVDISLLHLFRNFGSKALETKYAYSLVDNYPEELLATTESAATFYNCVGDEDKAVKMLDQCIKDCPENYKAYFELSKIYNSKDILPKAFSNLDSALSIYRGNIEILSYAVNLYKINEDIKKAAAVLDNWPEESPEKYIKYSELMLFDAKPEEALKYLDKGLSKFPKSSKLSDRYDVTRKYANLYDSLSLRTRTADTSVKWIATTDVAEQISKRESKPLLLYFSDKEDISSVYIDLAFTDPDVIELTNSFTSSKIYRNRNRKKATSLKISAYPSIIILNGDGEIISRFENTLGNVADLNVIKDFLNDGLNKHNSIVELKSKSEDVKYQTAKDFNHAQELALENDYPIMVVGSDTESELSQKFLKETLFHPSFMPNFKEMVLLTLDVKENINFFKSFRVDKFPAVLFFNQDISFISWKYGVQPKNILAGLIEKIKLYRTGQDYINPEINWIFNRDEAKNYAQENEVMILAYITDKEFEIPNSNIFSNPQVVKKINSDFIPYAMKLDSLSDCPMNGYEYYPMLAIMNNQGQIIYRTTVPEVYDELMTFLNIKDQESLLIALGTKKFEEMYEYFKLAYNLYNTNYFVSAENILVDIAMNYPQVSHVHIHLAENFLKRNELKKALHYSSILTQSEYTPEVHDIKVIVSSYLLDNRFGDLEKYLLDAKLSNFRNPTTVGLIYAALSEMEIALSNNSIAIQYAEKAIENDKTNPEHYFHLGKLFYLKNMKTAAINQFKVATILDPDMAKAYFYLYLLTGDTKALSRAKMLYHQGKYDQKPFRFIDTEYAYSQKGYTDFIHRELKDRLSLFPSYIDFKYDYAYFLSENDGNMTEALDMINLILKTDPENPRYNDTAAWIFYNLGDYQVANKLNTKALRTIQKDRYNKYPDILYHAGVIKASIGDKKSASQFFDLFLNVENLGGSFLKKIQYAKKYIKKMNK